MSELMCSQAKCRRKDERIEELKAELEKYVLKESGWVAYDIHVQSELQSKDQELAELREAIVLTDENNVLAAKMLLMFTKPDVDNYLLTGIVVNMALPGLKALQEKGG